MLGTTYPAYGLRGEVGRELVLYMMASEEDARQAQFVADAALKAYSAHISNPDKLTEFAKRQGDILMYATDRALYKRVDWGSLGGKSLEDDKVIQAMIEHFKYMKAHGIMGETSSDT